MKRESDRERGSGGAASLASTPAGGGGSLHPAWRGVLVAIVGLLATGFGIAYEVAAISVGGTGLCFIGAAWTWRQVRSLGAVGKHRR